MVPLVRAGSVTYHCTVEFYGGTSPHWGSDVRWLFSIDSYGIHYRKNTEDWRIIENAPQELKVGVACLCAGLMPPSVFADLLEDHRPDLSEVAQFLREWEWLKGEQK